MLTLRLFAAGLHPILADLFIGFLLYFLRILKHFMVDIQARKIYLIGCIFYIAKTLGWHCQAPTVGKPELKPYKEDSKMNDDAALLLGEKIMLIRKAKGLSLDNAAHATKISKSNLSRLERGTLKFNPRQLNKIKEFLEIKNAPLLEPELEIYKGRLWVWNDLIAANRMAEAQDMQQELSIILALPFEKELGLLYTMTYTRLLIKEHNIPAAEEKLNMAEGYINEACIAARFLFHRCRGSICCLHGEHKSGLMHLLKALEMGSSDIGPDISLFAQIGFAYLGLGKPYSALQYLERGKAEYQGDRTNNALIYLTNILATCYRQLGEYDKAKRLLEDTIIQAEILKDNHLLGTALANMSALYQKFKAYEQGIAFCDQALEYLKDDKQSYAITLLNKASALKNIRSLAKCKEILRQGAVLSEGSVNLAMMFEAQSHLMTMNVPSSIDYLENVAIPYFRAGTGFQKFIALNICKELELHLKKRKLKTKALAIGAIIREIYEDAFLGEVELEWGLGGFIGPWPL